MQFVFISQVLRLLRKLPQKTPEQNQAYNECKMHFYKGGAIFVLGFAIWNVDNLMCGELTEVRREFGGSELVGALTQGERVPSFVMILRD